jgi:dTMP kinase
MFITFEGVDGSGKTTQIQLLKRYIARRGVKVMVTREPGGTGVRLAEEIRELILHPRYRVHPRCELLLYEASRAQHVEELIRPKLAQGYWVLCDRYIDATVAYQGGGRKIPRRDLDRLNAFATGSLMPDATFFLDVPVSISIARARRLSAHKHTQSGYQRGDRIEQEKLAFHKRVRSVYRALAAHTPRIHRIRVAATIEQTHQRIVNVINQYL